MGWISSVGETILARKGIKVEDYVNDLQDLSTPIDQLGLLIIARMYHRHFAVFMKDYVWSTRRDNSIENCAIYFAYNGGCTFLDTVEVEPTVNADDNLDLFVEDMKANLECEEQPHGAGCTSPPRNFKHSSDSEVSSDEQESTSYGPPVFPGESALSGNTASQSTSYPKSTSSPKSTSYTECSPSKRSRLDKPKSKPHSKPKPAKPLKASKANKAAKRAKAVEALEKARAAKRKKYLEKQERDRKLAEELQKEEDLKSKFNCSDVSIEIDKCDNDTPLMDRKSKPKQLTEKDPILDHVSRENPDQVDLLTEEDNAPKSRGSSKISETEHVTTDGKLKCTGYGLPKPKKQKKNLKCPDSDCSQVFPFVKELNKHMKDTHPDVKFKCAHCPRQYETHNARYKHEHTHFQLPYSCHYCTKRFLFPGQRDRHEGSQHTRQNLLPCTWPGCQQQLSSKDALRQHVDTHTDERHSCELCPKTFNTVSNLKQHIKGAHEDGFISLCGCSFDWSDKCNEHQKECTECQRLKEEKLHLPVNPVKPKQWRKSIAKDASKPFLWMCTLTNYMAKKCLSLDRCSFPFV